MAAGRSRSGALAWPRVSVLNQIRPGLFRWTVRHPEWRPNAKPESPADWPPEVGSVLCHAQDATVLIDPLLPSPAEPGFMVELDRRVSERRLPVVDVSRRGGAPHR